MAIRKRVSALPLATALQSSNFLLGVQDDVRKQFSFSVLTEGLATDTSFGIFWVKAPIPVGSATDAEANADNINAAITAANLAGGGTVFLRAGVYEVKDDTAGSKGYAIKMKSSVRLVGHSAGTVIKMYALETRPHSIMENDVGGVSDCEIANITFDGSKSRVSDTEWGVNEHEGIDLKSPTRVWIHHCTIFDCGTDAIDLDTATDCIVSDCFIYDCGGCAVHGSGDRISITNICSENCSIYRHQSTSASVRDAAGAVSWGSGDYLTISNCKSKNDAAGVVLISCDRSVVADCTCENPGDGNAHGTWPDAYAGGGFGVVFRDGCISSVAVGCTYFGRNIADSFGGYVDGSTNVRCLFVGCSMTQGKRCFQISEGQWCGVIGSVANAGVDRNIAFDNAGDGCIAQGNVVYGGANGVRVEGGTDDAIISGNSVYGCTNVGLYAIGASDAISFIGNKAAGCGTGLKFLDSGGTPTNCIALDNDVQGNTTNTSFAGTGHIIKNNAGHNPVGVSAISVTASPFTYTAGYHQETVYIHGGTVSDVAKSSTTIAAATGVSVELEPGESVTVTYSSAPTMVKDEH